MEQNVRSFCLRLVCLFLLFAGATWIDRSMFDERAASKLVGAVAEVVCFAMSAAGRSVSLAGDTILYGKERFRVVPECTGLDALFIYVAAVVALRCGWRAKLKGIVLGVVILVPINLLRVTSLVWVGGESLEMLDRLHLWAWPSVVLIATVATLVGWARGTDLTA